MVHDRGNELFDSIGQGWVQQCQRPRERLKITSRRLRAVEKETNKTRWTSSNIAKAANTDSTEMTVWQPWMPGSIRKQDDNDDTVA